MDLKHGGHIIQPEQSFLHSHPTDHIVVFVGKISLVSHSLSIRAGFSLVAYTVGDKSCFTDFRFRE